MNNIIIKKIIYILICKQLYFAATLANFSHNELTPISDSINSCHGNNNSSDLKFRLPFMDIEFKTERNLIIMKESITEQFFVLHGNELYQLFVNSRERKLSLVGLLIGNVQQSEALAAQVIYWNKYLLIAIALEDGVEIYEISPTTSTDDKMGKVEKERLTQIEPIQQLNLFGRFRKLFLIEPAKDHVVLIIAVNFTKLHGKIRVLNWMNTYFEPVEELTVPPINVIYIVGTYPKYLISGRILRQTKTVLSISEIGAPTFNLRKVQTLTVESLKIFAVNFLNQSYIIGCNGKKNCYTFRMGKNRQFNLYQHLTNNELSFESVEGSDLCLVAARQNEVRVFTNKKLRCFTNFKTNESEVTSIDIHRNDHGENFILLNYKRPFYTILRTIELELDEQALKLAISNDSDLSDLGLHKHLFENTIGKLRSLLLKRKSTMDLFLNINDILNPKFSKYESKTPINLRAGNVSVVNIIDANIRSPVQIMERVENLRQNLLHSRRVREVRNNLTNSTAEIPKNIKVKKLKVRNLIYRGDIFKGFYLEKSTRSYPILTIHQPVTTKYLQTKKLITRTLVNDKLRQQLVSVPKIDVEKLFVKNINGMPWNDLYESLYLKNRNTKIKGRLVLQSSVGVTNLTTPVLNDLKMNEVFNLREPQTIKSNILISGFYFIDMQVESVNGLNFTEDIVFRGKDNIIDTPVSMHDVTISGDLILKDNVDSIARTSEEEFHQYYSGNVVIEGSLHINNLRRDFGESTKIIIAEDRLQSKQLQQKYLLNNTNQIFNTTAIFGNANITLPSFNTTFLNGHPTEEHLLRNQTTNQHKPLYLILLSSSINGDLILKNYKSKLSKINKQAIRYGEVANITGKKLFEAPLYINNLMTLALNEVNVNDLVAKDALQNNYTFTGIKTFNNIITDHAYIVEQLNATHLNGLPLNKLLNYDYHFDQFYVPHKLYTNNIVFEQLNGLPFDDIFAKFNMNNEQLVLHKDLIIEGNVLFEKNLWLKNINGINWNAYVKNLVRNSANAIIEDDIHFNQEITITKSLNTSTINDMKMHKIFNNILSKSKAQLITGAYTFDNLFLNNLDVNIINNVPTAAFISTQQPDNFTLIIDGDLILPAIHINGSLNGDLKDTIDLPIIEKQLRKVPTLSNWQNLVVLNSVNITHNNSGNTTQYDRLNYLHRHAVTNTNNHNITGNVKLNYPRIINMQTKTKFSTDVDLEMIASDSLLRNSKKGQNIFAPKTFKNSLYMNNVTVDAPLNTKFLNDIDIARFNASLYRISSRAPIIGPLYFEKPPTFTNLYIKGLINGINTSSIYYISNETVSELIMSNLIITNNLQLNDVNDMSLNYLLENRITKAGRALEVFGTLEFENLIINKEILIRSINNISIDNLVFTESDELQAITGAKYLNGDLILNGPAHVMNMNGENLIEKFQNTIFLNRNYNFENLTVDKVSFENGLIILNQEMPFGRNKAISLRNNSGSDRRMNESN